MLKAPMPAGESRRIAAHTPPTAFERAGKCTPSVFREAPEVRRRAVEPVGEPSRSIERLMERSFRSRFGICPVTSRVPPGLAGLAGCGEVVFRTAGGEEGRYFLEHA